MSNSCLTLLVALITALPPVAVAIFLTISNNRSRRETERNQIKTALSAELREKRVKAYEKINLECDKLIQGIHEGPKDRHHSVPAFRRAIRNPIIFSDADVKKAVGNILKATDKEETILDEVQKTYNLLCKKVEELYDPDI